MATPVNSPPRLNVRTHVDADEDADADADEDEDEDGTFFLLVSLEGVEEEAAVTRGAYRKRPRCTCLFQRGNATRNVS